MSGEAIPQTVALRLQLAMIAGDEPAGIYIEVRTPRAAPQLRQQFPRVGELPRAARIIANLAQLHDTYVGAAPRVRECGRDDAIKRVWTLWADCDTAEAANRLRAFRPRPSIVLRSGSGGNLHGWWQLSRPMTPEQARRANRRIAQAVAGDMASTNPGRLLRPAGTLNHKHKPPRPVQCVYLTAASYTAPEVIGHLPDPPQDRPAPRQAPPPHQIDYDTTLEGLLHTAAQAEPGNRNNALFWAACRVAEHGLDSPEVREALTNAAGSTGLPEHEIATTIRSALDTQKAA